MPRINFKRASAVAKYWELRSTANSLWAYAGTKDGGSMAGYEAERLGMQLDEESFALAEDIRNGKYGGR